MAAWLTVYCSRSVGHVQADDLITALDPIDFFTVAEGFGIDDESVVKKALEQLTIESISEPVGVKFCLRYRPAEIRPVLIHLWAEPARVQSERKEALEQLDGATRPGANGVRAHLAEVVEVVAVELGWSELEQMGIVFGGQVAEFFASVGKGLIRDQNDDWWAIQDGVPVGLVRPKRRN